MGIARANAERAGPDIQEATGDAVLEIIEENAKASWGIGGFWQLDRFMTETVLPYATRWQERTLRFIEESKKARNVMDTALNKTRGVVKAFSSSTEMTLFKTVDVVSELAAILAEESYRLNKDGWMGVDVDLIVRFLHIVAICEVFSLVMFLVCMQKCMKKKK
jgi:hypothetical protein